MAASATGRFSSDFRIVLAAFERKGIPQRTEPIFWQYAKGGTVRDSNWKLVTRPSPKDFSKGEIERELYDVVMDFMEMNDLAKERPKVVARLSTLWHTWYRESYGMKPSRDGRIAESRISARCKYTLSR